MIKYSFKYNKNHNTILAERILDFLCTAGISYEKFSIDKKLQTAIIKLDKKYGLSDSLYSSLYTQLLNVNHLIKDIKNIYKRVEEKIIIDTSGETKDQLYNELLQENILLYSKGQHPTFASIKFQSYKDNLETYNAKYNINVSETDLRKLYLVYLYVTNLSGKLFWCINTLFEDINIVDSYNLASYIGTSPNIIIPLQELTRGTKTIKHSISYTGDMIPRELIYEQGFVKKLMMEFDNDIEELRASHRYIGSDLLKECQEWLGNTDIQKLTIENKKNYRLVKPTLLKNKEKTKSAEDAIDSYGSIEIKKHILNGSESRQVYLTPCYKVWKYEKKNI